MKIHPVLFFCLLSALCDAETFIRAEGSSIMVGCPFSLSGRRKLLCKDECKDEDVLIGTDGDRAQSGRYSILYKPGTFPVSSTVVYVGIAPLTKSDSGRYRCGLERPYFPDAHWEFDIIVTDAPKTFPESVKQPEQQQTEETAAGATLHSDKGYALPLVAGVTVVVLLAAVVLLFCRCKTGLNSRGQSDDRNMEFTTFVKCPRCEDFTSPAVDETNSNQWDKIYCNL